MNVGNTVFNHVYSKTVQLLPTHSEEEIALKFNYQSSKNKACLQYFRAGIEFGENWEYLSLRVPLSSSGTALTRSWG